MPETLKRNHHKTKPADGAAVTAPPSPVKVRQQIVDMTGHKDDKAFAESLPDSTANAGGEAGEKVRAKRRTKAEIEAERGVVIDPLMTDPRYVAAIGRMNALGGPAAMKTVFKMTGKPLDHEESLEWDDAFYVASKKGGLDPGKSWWLMGLYAFFLLCRHVVARTDLGEMLKHAFEPKPIELPKEEKKENLDHEIAESYGRES